MEDDIESGGESSRGFDSDSESISDTDSIKTVKPGELSENALSLDRDVQQTASTEAHIQPSDSSSSSNTLNVNEIIDINSSMSDYEDSFVNTSTTSDAKGGTDDDTDTLDKVAFVFTVKLKRLERELLKKSQNSIVLHCDNKRAIQVAKNNSYSSRTKHVEIKSRFIQEKVNDGQIQLKYLSTDKNIADVLTKGITGAKHEVFSKQFGLD